MAVPWHRQRCEKCAHMANAVNSNFRLLRRPASIYKTITRGSMIVNGRAVSLLTNIFLLSVDRGMTKHPHAEASETTICNHDCLDMTRNGFS